MFNIPAIIPKTNNPKGNTIIATKLRRHRKRQPTKIIWE
jgi:hypothetical protein